jgi:hypothetical protein
VLLSSFGLLLDFGLSAPCYHVPSSWRNIIIMIIMIIIRAARPSAAPGRGWRLTDAVRGREANRSNPAGQDS